MPRNAIEAARQIHGSLSVPYLWVAIVVLFALGIFASRAGSKALGIPLLLLGAILLLTTPIGHNLKAALTSLLNG
jgi:hypothetical protein